MKRLSKSGIEYLTHMWSPYSGCKNWSNGICAVKRCWAKGLVTRFHKRYPNGFEPTYYPENLLLPLSLKKPARIGVAWLGDMMGHADPETADWLYSVPSATFKWWIFRVMRNTPHHTYFILTKNPERLKLWEPFPDNCYVGCSVTDYWHYVDACNYLSQIKAKHKWLSIEPLFLWDEKPTHFFRAAGISWVAIGQQTPVHTKTQPYETDIEDIVHAADKVGIPVWLKDNLKNLALRQDICYRNGKLRQELPRITG